MKLLFLVFLILTGSFVAAQTTDDLFDRLGDWDESEALAIKTFRSTRIVNMQSVENPYQGELIFTIGHRFGNLSSICTHQGCAITYNHSNTNFPCPCHGSVFSAQGSVLEGPATTAVKRYSVTRERNVLTITG